MSWIELYDGTLLYLTTDDIKNTKRGRELQKQLTWNDLVGHAAIKMFHGQDPHSKFGNEREVTDFSKPRNFPREIARAIKRGAFWDLILRELLTKAGWAAYSKYALRRYLRTKAICDPLYKRYDRAAYRRRGNPSKLYAKYNDLLTRRNALDKRASERYFHKLFMDLATRAPAWKR
jgi:hypothetical protein